MRFPKPLGGTFKISNTHNKCKMPSSRHTHTHTLSSRAKICKNHQIQKTIKILAKAHGHGHGHGPRAMVPRSTNDFQGHPGGFPAPMGSLRARTCAPGLASSAAWPWPGQALAKPLFFLCLLQCNFHLRALTALIGLGAMLAKG